VAHRAAFHRILCAVDGGAMSDEAVRQAAVLAGPQTELSLLAFAIDNGSVHPWLEQGEALAAELGVEARLRVARGANPPHLLLDASGGADLLVVGGGGEDRPGQVVLGSIASSAVHAAEVPVLVVRPPPKGRDFPRDILIATDGSADSERGVELAGTVAGTHGSRIALVHVSEGRSQAHATLEHDARTVGEMAGVAAATIEEFGDPAGQIAKVARREGASLLVVGSRGLGGAQRLGSVGERLAHEAPCSVLVARPS
jgi:nucleotide-binding universal stress UspA family protein